MEGAEGRDGGAPGTGTDVISSRSSRSSASLGRLGSPSAAAGGGGGTERAFWKAGPTGETSTSVDSIFFSAMRPMGALSSGAVSGYPASAAA